jgi:hypothetical protein
MVNWDGNDGQPKPERKSGDIFGDSGAPVPESGPKIEPIRFTGPPLPPGIKVQDSSGLAEEARRWDEQQRQTPEPAKQIDPHDPQLKKLSEAGGPHTTSLRADAETDPRLTSDKPLTPPVIPPGTRNAAAGFQNDTVPDPRD